MECSREDISKASEWGKIIAYIAERVKVNKEIGWYQLKNTVISMG